MLQTQLFKHNNFVYIQSHSIHVRSCVRELCSYAYVYHPDRLHLPESFVVQNEWVHDTAKDNRDMKSWSIPKGEEREENKKSISREFEEKGLEMCVPKSLLSIRFGCVEQASKVLLKKKKGNSFVVFTVEGGGNYGQLGFWQ